MRSRSLTTALLLVFFSTAAFAQVARRPFLFKDSRGELAAARARGDKNVLLVIASMPGANARAAQTITSLGGTVRFRDDEVDYLRALVPVESVEKLVSDPSVHSVDVNVYAARSFASAEPVDETIAAGTTVAARRSQAQDTTRKRMWPPVLPDNPISNRYDPLRDIGAADFRKKHPTFDGRGVTIAMIDMNPDVLLPEVQLAKSLDGKTIPKVAVYETALDGDEEDGAGRWLRMNDTVVASGKKFSYKDKSYIVPRDGIFRIAILDESKYDSTDTGLGKDLNRDGNPDGSSRFFAVIWDEQSNDVWVDTDQNLNFTNEKRLTDFSVHPEFGVFGVDKPKTPVRESIAFGLQIDRARKLVGINAAIASHASLVMGAAIGSKGKSGRFDGVAPGAQLASVSEGGAVYGQTEALIRALKNPKIDLAFLEQSSVVSGNYLLRDGRLVPTVIYERLIAKYKKPIISPTHNYAKLNGVDDYVMAPGVLGIGAHESADNFFLNFGFRVKHKDGLHTTGGYGPMGDGSIAPHIMAPSNILSTKRGFEGPSIMANVYRLPPGYTIAGGTSTATPTASGAVALLISAAKQSGIKHDALRLHQAITMSGRYLDHIPEYKQGNGVINVAAAWEMLKVLDTLKTPITITSRAPVQHSYSHMLATPNEGVGIFERDGWNVGNQGQRTVTFTRTSGPAEPMSYALGWIGNGGTFSAPKTVSLPLNQPVQVAVGIAPTEAGVHSALITLGLPGASSHAYRVPVTIVAAEALTAANNYKIERKTEVPRPEMRSYFYRVPDGASALQIEVDAPKRDLALSVLRPDTRTARSVRIGAAPAAPGAPSANRPKATYLVTDLGPGVWEIRLSDTDDTRNFDWEAADKPDPVPPTQVTLTVSAFGVEVGNKGVALAGSAATTEAPELSVTNTMATFTGATAGMALGAARRERPTIRDKEQRVFEVEVPAGSTALVARVRNPSDRGADLDVFIYDCSGKRCRSAGVSADPLGDNTVMVQNPAAGKWKIVVDAPLVPSGSTSFDYLDVLFNPGFGAVNVTDYSQSRPMGAQWTTKAQIWDTRQIAAAGYLPFAAALMQLQIGSERVTIQMLELGGNEKR